MFPHVWSRLSSAPGTSFQAFVAGLLIIVLDLASAGYVMVLFRKFGEPGFELFSTGATLALLIVLLIRTSLSWLRLRALRDVASSGPDGDAALILRASAADRSKRPGALVATKTVSGAFGADGLVALMDLPAVVVFAGAVFVVAGPATGTACAALLVSVAVIMDLASKRARRFGSELVKAEAALATAEGAAEAEECALEVEARRRLVDGAASTDRGIGVLASGLMLAAAVGVGCILDGGSGGPAGFVAANILAGRALGILIAGAAALGRMASALPARIALDTEL